MEVTESRAEPNCWSPANTEVGQVKAFCHISVVEICQWVYFFRQQPLACFLCPVHLWKLVCSQQNRLGQPDSSGNKARQRWRARFWVALSHVFNSPFPGFWVIKRAPFHISKKKRLWGWAKKRSWVLIPAVPVAGTYAKTIFDFPFSAFSIFWRSVSVSTYLTSLKSRALRSQKTH